MIINANARFNESLRYTYIGIYDSYFGYVDNPL